MRRITTTRLVAAAATLAALLPLAATIAASPATAGTVDTRRHGVDPVTWVDDQGRQLTATSVYPQQGPFEHVLVVARDLPDGTPDAAWGTFAGQPGVRRLEAAAPATNLTGEPVLAASPEGVITLAWTSPAACTGSDPCLALTRVLADGTAVGSPWTTTDPLHSPSALPDGSILVAGAPGGYRWLGPDGIGRGDVGSLGGLLQSATVDTEGRLLLAIDDGRVLRKAAGSTGRDQVVEEACTPSATSAIGAAADGGFAVACGTVGTTPVTVSRFTEDGDGAWTTTGTDADRGLTQVTRVAVDDDDRVWVGGTAGSSGYYDAVVVAPYTSDGPEPTAYRRPTTSRIGWPEMFGTPGLSDLRANRTGVVLADARYCCAGGPFAVQPESEVIATKLPAVPMCQASSLRRSTSSSGGLRLSTCTAVPAGPVLGTTSYEVEVRTPSGTTTEVLTPAGPDTEVTYPLATITRGVAVSITVTVTNEEGPSLGPPLVVRTVLPFWSTAAFLAQVTADLGEAGTSGLGEAAARIDAGTATPVAEAVDRFRFSYHLSGRIEPLLRLYRAYVGRDADPGGLTYWAERLRQGTRLVAVSEAFAASNEFRTRYGSLTNRAFVSKVYQSTLGRPADAAGLAYWTKRLDSRKATRGGVMVQFSESSEFVRTSAPLVQPSAATWLFLGRFPTPLERSAWAAAPNPRAAAVAAILPSAEYAERFAP